MNDPQAVRFCNEHVRTVADAYCQLYYALKVAQAVYVGQDIDTKIGGDPQDTVEDGSATDGRPILTVGEVQALIATAGTLISEAEAEGGARLNTFLRAAVNPVRGGAV